MWRPKTSRRIVFLLVLVIGACGGGGDPAPGDFTPGPGAESPEIAVQDLTGYLNTPDFDSASALAVPSQAALAALTEGATFSDVADALATGDLAVAANFWSGFAQGSGELLTGQVTTEPLPTIIKDDIEFHPVSVISDSGETRQMMTRDIDGHRVDLFASFGAGLADKMIPPVERLLSAQTADARLILTELKAIVPSLLLAAEQPDLPPAIVQEILQLVELITRVS